LASVTSQALQYDGITCTPYEGLNYIILSKITQYESALVNHPKFK